MDFFFSYSGVEFELMVANLGVCPNSPVNKAAKEKKSNCPAIVREETRKIPDVDLEAPGITQACFKICLKT